MYIIMHVCVHRSSCCLLSQDAAIKHLTEERHRWHHDVSYDARSYAPSRLMAPDAGGLSDGALSDTGTMEPEGKETKKKSKKWKVSSEKRVKSSQDNHLFSPISLCRSSRCVVRRRMR